MLHVLDVRDALDTDRFLHVHFDPVFEAQSSQPGGASGTKSGPLPSEEQGGLITMNLLVPVLLLHFPQVPSPQFHPPSCLHPCGPTPMHPLSKSEEAGAVLGSLSFALT